MSALHGMYNYVAAATAMCILTFIDDIYIHIALSHLTMCTFVHVHCIQCDTLDDMCLLFPPHINVRSGELEVVTVKYLMEVQGCSARCTDNSGQTPLHCTCW